MRPTLLDIVSVVEPVQVLGNCSSLLHIADVTCSVNADNISADTLFVGLRVSRDDDHATQWYPSRCFDGNGYYDTHGGIPRAFALGCRAVLCEKIPVGIPPGAIVVLVRNSRVALGKLARAVIDICGSRVIAVTGSSGKSTCVHMLRTALRYGCAEVQKIYTKRPNPISFPVAILNTLMRPGNPVQDLVVEMPTDHVGCISTLAAIAQPGASIVLNVRDAHLNAFGDLETTQRAKAEIIRALPATGIAVLNADDVRVSRMEHDLPATAKRRVIFFGSTQKADVNTRIIRRRPTSTLYELQYRDCRARIDLPLIGASSADLVGAAIAGALAMDRQFSDALAGLSMFEPMLGRMSWTYLRDEQIAIFDNSAKTNTSNIRHLCESLATTPRPGCSILVLGEFLADEHPMPDVSLVKLLQTCFDKIILVSPAHREDITLVGTSLTVPVEECDNPVHAIDRLRTHILSAKTPLHITVAGRSDANLGSIARQLEHEFAPRKSDRISARLESLHSVVEQ